MRLPRNRYSRYGSGLKADPSSVSIAASGGSFTVSLSNGGASKVHPVLPRVTHPSTSLQIAFKVRSSNNTEYRIDPVFGSVAAGEKSEEMRGREVDTGSSLPLTIVRLAGPPKEDKLAIQ